MQIGIKAPILRKILLSDNCTVFDKYDDIPHYSRSRLKEFEINDEKGISEDSIFTFQLPNYNLKQLNEILAYLEKFEAPTKTIETVKRWLETIKDPLNGEVSNVQSLFKVFDVMIKKLPNSWLFKENEDGELNPVLVKDYKYQSRRRDESEYFTLSYTYGLFSPKDKDSIHGCHLIDENIYFYQWSILDDCDYMDFETYYFPELKNDDNNDNDESDDDKPKTKKVKKSKKETLKLVELLAKKQLYVPTPDLMKKYQEQMRNFYKIYKLNGKQFTVEGMAFQIKEEGYRNNMNLVSMEEDDVKNKVVIDNVKPVDNVKINIDTEKTGSKPIPYHPYVRVYDITKYRPAMVHVDKMIEYKYSKDIINDIILPEKHKTLLNKLISGEVDFKDVVQGKSGGIIILCSGISGTGKTLTAEIYSEVVEKPLYQIQSHQLGITPKEIEENLYKVLRQADKWNAVLLIDECDTYVYKRGTDMLQNCIVGVFLRLFEYYNGILFLTTNKHDIIDEAILSRLTAHIRYSVFSKSIQVKILLLLAKKFNIDIEKKEAEFIIEEYKDMTGRDSRNLLKLIKKYYQKNNNASIKFKLGMIEPIKEFIPFINKPINSKVISE